MLSKAEVAAKKILPAPVYRAVRDVAEYACALGFALRFGLFALPDVLLFFGVTPGDDLLCTAVLRELRKRDRGTLWMASNHRELFAGNDDAWRVVPSNSHFGSFVKVWRSDFRYLKYADYDAEKDGSTVPRRHIIAELCSRAGVTGPVTLRPYLLLTEGEIAKSAWASGRIVVQSSGLAAKFPMRNKEWYPERFQAVVDSLSDEYEFVQLGSATDPALRNAKDLRGLTSVRQSAAILHHARLYIGGVGFLMHLARAVECPSAIIYGGREAPWQSGYVCNVNLHTALPCAPCWHWNTCEFDRKCMADITSDDVVRAVRQLLRKPRNPLEAENVNI